MGNSNYKCPGWGLFVATEFSIQKRNRLDGSHGDVKSKRGGRILDYKVIGTYLYDLMADWKIGKNLDGEVVAVILECDNLAFFKMLEDRCLGIIGGINRWRIQATGKGNNQEQEGRFLHEGVP